MNSRLRDPEQKVEFLEGNRVVVRRPGEAERRPFEIAVLRITGGRIAEITAFHDPGLFAAFALPTALPPPHR